MKLLLLAGTQEARALALALERSDGIRTLASLAGATRAPRALPCPTRIGGFGGPEGFGDFLRAEKIDMVVDATHPFAARMSQTACAVTSALGVDIVRLSRPPWTPSAGDRWSCVRHEAEVAPLVPPGSTVFLATGRKTLEQFANLAHATLICRRIDPPRNAFPFANGRWLVGRPPFGIEEEMSLFQSLGIDWLVTKNTGGAASRAKLDAARRLDLPVAMIARPDLPACRSFEDVGQLAAWLEERCAHAHP